MLIKNISMLLYQGQIFFNPTTDSKNETTKIKKIWDSHSHLRTFKC